MVCARVRPARRYRSSSEMARGNSRKLDRRHFLRITAGSPGLFASGSAHGQKKKTLRIAKWAHFLPEFDHWFDTELVTEWGKQHDAQVVVDHIPVEKINALAAAEVAARKGHDLIMFPWP